VLVGPVSDDVLSRAFGLELPRTLRRHSFVSLLSSAGIPIEDIARWLLTLVVARRADTSGRSC
jgi:hypothetical protein